MNSKILFDDIYNEIMNDNALNSSYYNLFDKLTVINEGTYRSAEKQFGWKDILIRCDYIEKVNSQIKIFGSPIFVTTNTPVDYGWYKPIRYSNRYFYEYDGSNFTGKMIISKSIHENFKKNLDSKIKIDFKSGISFIDKDNILLLKQNITTTVESTESVKYPDLNNLYDYSEILAINIPYEVIRN